LHVFKACIFGFADMYVASASCWYRSQALPRWCLFAGLH